MKNISSYVNLKIAESLLWNMPSAVSGYDLALPFHSIAWRDYSWQSELVARYRGINSTINALTRTDIWHWLVERSNNNILEAATWKFWVQMFKRTVPLWPLEENCLLRCWSHSASSISWEAARDWDLFKWIRDHSANFKFIQIVCLLESP